MPVPKLTLVLGIRPDVIRASLLIKLLKADSRIELRFVWSGQHYSDNLKDVFFRELNVTAPDFELGIKGESDAAITASIINNLHDELITNRPDAIMFLGDTNTVLGSISAAQLNIPIFHIEGCMRSYDWRMPEEKNRVIIDNLSDVIYAYFDEYKQQGILEGLQDNRIVVTQNLIVDVLNEYYFPKREEFVKHGHELKKKYKVSDEYYLATAHRRENVEEEESLQGIINLFQKIKSPIIFPASYRTQKSLKRFGIQLPKNVTLIDPIGYFDMLSLLTTAAAVVTDSGTVVEEAAVIGTPSVQMRRSTERPQTYDCRSSVKFDPKGGNFEEIPKKMKLVVGSTWEHGLGDGQASARIADDVVER